MAMVTYKPADSDYRKECTCADTRATKAKRSTTETQQMTVKTTAGRMVCKFRRKRELLEKTPRWFRVATGQQGWIGSETHCAWCRKRSSGMSKYQERRTLGLITAPLTNADVFGVCSDQRPTLRRHAVACLFHFLVQ